MSRFQFNRRQQTVAKPHIAAGGGRVQECPFRSSCSGRLDDWHGRNPVAAPGWTQGLLAIIAPDEDNSFVAA